jgi:hypothetical protein
MSWFDGSIPWIGSNSSRPGLPAIELFGTLLGASTWQLRECSPYGIEEIVMAIFIARLLPVLVGAICGGFSGASGSDERNQHGPPTLNEVSMEVLALQALRQLDLDAAQLEAIRKIVRETGQPAGARQAAQCSEKYRQTLSELRAALAKPNDSDRILDLENQLENLRDSENPDMDDNWEITEAARDRAPEVFRLLSARQVVAYLRGYGDQLGDPYELITEALDKVRGMSDEEWKVLREIVGEDVGRQAAGLDAARGVEIGEKIIQLMIQARAMKENEFKSQRAELLRSARNILGNPSSLDVIRHSVEYTLAELLSNPRLPAAIAAVPKK